MNRAALIALLILLAWAIALLVRLPATWALSAISFPDTMADKPFGAPDGTLWRGSTHQIAPLSNTRPLRLTWRWRPGDLRQGRFAYDLKLSDTAHRGAAVLSFIPFAGRRLDVTELDAPLHALLAGLQVIPIRPRGNISLSALTVAHNGKAFTAAHGNLQWRNAGLGWPVGNNLGTVQARPTLRQGALRLNVTGSGGSLDLNGWLELAPDLSRFDLHIRLQPTTHLPAQEQRWLNAALPRQSDGRFLLSFSGAL